MRQCISSWTGIGCCRVRRPCCKPKAAVMVRRLRDGRRVSPVPDWIADYLAYCFGFVLLLTAWGISIGISIRWAWRSGWTACDVAMKRDRVTRAWLDAHGSAPTVVLPGQREASR